MQTILIFLLVTIFSLISILHFYWAFGGKWAFDDALPTNEKGEKILESKAFECAVVGFGLILFAFLLSLTPMFIMWKAFRKSAPITFQKALILNTFNSF